MTRTKRKVSSSATSVRRSVGEVKPTGKITIRAYNIGFGDCFLLKFPYSDSDGGDRFILVDFGTSSRPKKTTRDLTVKIAKDIKKQCKGHLNAVVVTHRHKDHLSGFRTKRRGKGSGEIIASLKPDLIVQPWTEDPKLPTDATSPKGIYAEGLRLALNFVKIILHRILLINLL
jgi:glyoxylase-like metal-dependent hydrolase (beta-lactamase superfamily II)